VRRLIATLAMVGLLVGGCGMAPHQRWGDSVPTPDPSVEAARLIVAQTPEGVTLQPISIRGAELGRPYRYTIPHCGLMSPIDIDGSFWGSVTQPPDPAVFDGQPGVFVVETPSTATFTTDLGESVRLARHDGAKAFPLCA
jgi:hypothetical protein